MPTEQDAPRSAGTDQDAKQPQQQPSTTEFERYDEAVADKVEGIDGASAAGPTS